MAVINIGYGGGWWLKFCGCWEGNWPKEGKGGGGTEKGEGARAR